METNGPARAVTVNTGDCWKCGSDVTPQVFECQLVNPKPAGQLVFRVLEGCLQLEDVLNALNMLEISNPLFNMIPPSPT